MTLRILHCHSTFARGGKELRSVRVMNAVGPLARHVIVSAMPGDLAAREAIDPNIGAAFPVDAPPLAGRPSAARYRTLAAFMQPFDLVLTYNWGALDAVMARRIFGKSLPPLVHHEDGFNQDESHRLKVERTLFRRLAFPAVSKIVVPSRTLENVALRTWRQPRARVRMIANGVDLAVGVPPLAIPGFVRRRGQFVIGTVAGLRAVKNLPMLVRAAAKLPNAVLVILGEGPEREAIAAEAKACGIADRLVMPGFLPEPARYIGQFDLFALSSHSEQAPLALMQAMAAGRPVVATDVGDVRVMVADANRAFVVPANDEDAFSGAMIRLAGNGNLRSSLGAANAAKARSEFDEQRMIAEYLHVYAHVLGGRARTLFPGVAPFGSV